MPENRATPEAPAEQEGLGFGVTEQEDTRSFAELPEVESAPPIGGFLTQKPHPNQVDYEGLLFKFSPEKSSEMKRMKEEHQEKLYQLTTELVRLQSEADEKALAFKTEFESRLSPIQLSRLTEVRLRSSGNTLKQAQLKALLISALLRMQSSEQLTVLEGVSRSRQVAGLSKLIEDEVISNQSGSWFYDEPLQPGPELKAKLLSICLNPNSFRDYRPGKLCGGFHADLAIRARGEEDPVSLLICLSCHEARLVEGGAILMFDLDDGEFKLLEAVATKLFRHRNQEN